MRVWHEWRTKRSLRAFVSIPTATSLNLSSASASSFLPTSHLLGDSSCILLPLRSPHDNLYTWRQLSFLIIRALIVSKFIDTSILFVLLCLQSKWISFVSDRHNFLLLLSPVSISSLPIAVHNFHFIRNSKWSINLLSFSLPWKLVSRIVVVGKCQSVCHSHSNVVNWFLKANSNSAKRLCWFCCCCKRVV